MGAAEILNQSFYEALASTFKPRNLLELLCTIPSRSRSVAPTCWMASQETGLTQ